MDIVDLSSLNFAAAIVEQCREELKKIRWIDGFVCPACGHGKAYQLKSRDQLECANKKCKRQTSPTAGTQFHNSRLLEKVWVMLSEYQNNLAALTKRKIKALMNVTACTARRIAWIISSSFKSKNDENSSDVLKLAPAEEKIWSQERLKVEQAPVPDRASSQMLVKDNGVEPQLILLIQLQNRVELKCKSRFLFSRLNV